jgi:hypothetical protein
VAFLKATHESTATLPLQKPFILIFSLHQNLIHKIFIIQTPAPLDYFFFGHLLESPTPPFIAESIAPFQRLLHISLYLSLSLLISFAFMAKGSGLSIDSADPFGFFPHRPIVLNSFPEDSNNNNNIISRNIHKWKLSTMDATLNRSPPSSSTIQFPLNLNCSHHHEDSPPLSDDKRMVIDEMDFFAEKSHDNEAFSTDKKDLDCPTSLEFNVNVRARPVL